MALSIVDNEAQLAQTKSLTYWVTHISVSKLGPIIGSGNGMSPERRQVIIWTNAGIFSIGFFEQNVRGIHHFSYKNMKMSPAICRSLCLGLSMLIGITSILSGIINGSPELTRSDKSW